MTRCLPLLVLLGCPGSKPDSGEPSPHLITLQGDVAINELLADNDLTIADEDGDFDDWVELYNRGEEAVDLTGWQLSDGWPDDVPWTLPAGTVLEPGAFLLVWCDNDDDNAHPLHTDFELRQTGELLTLLDAAGAVMDQVLYPHLQGDIAYARYPDGTRGWRTLEPPTPLGPNNRINER